jgi:hypothetical protein
LAADIRRLAAAFGAKPGRDLVSFARHALNNFLRNGGVVFAAFKSFVEQFNAKIRNLLASALRDLFFDLATTEVDFRNRAG